MINDDLKTTCFSGISHLFKIFISVFIKIFTLGLSVFLKNNKNVCLFSKFTKENINNISNGVIVNSINNFYFIIKKESKSYKIENNNCNVFPK